MFSDPEYQDEIVQHAKSLDHARANQLINEEHRAHVKTIFVHATQIYTHYDLLSTRYTRSDPGT